MYRLCLPAQARRHGLELAEQFLCPCWQETCTRSRHIGTEMTLVLRHANHTQTLALVVHGQNSEEGTSTSTEFDISPKHSCPRIRVHVDYSSQTYRVVNCLLSLRGSKLPLKSLYASDLHSEFGVRRRNGCIVLFLHVHLIFIVYKQ